MLNFLKKKNLDSLKKEIQKLLESIEEIFSSGKEKKEKEKAIQTFGDSKKGNHILKSLIWKSSLRN